MVTQCTCTWNQSTCSYRIEQGHGHEAKSHLWSLSSWSSRVLFSQRWQHLNITRAPEIPLVWNYTNSAHVEVWKHVKTYVSRVHLVIIIIMSCTLHFTLINKFIGGSPQIRQERPYSKPRQLTSLLSQTETLWPRSFLVHADALRIIVTKSGKLCGFLECDMYHRRKKGLWNSHIYTLINIYIYIYRMCILYRL